MNFDYNEEQQLLADSLRRYLQAQYSFEQRKKALDGAPEVWAKFAEMGLLALPLSPDYGGFGGGAVDLMAIMEAFGEALVVEPYLATVMASRLVARAGSPSQKSAVLPAVAEGRLKLAFAHTEGGARYDLEAVKCTARKTGGQWLIEGEKKAVQGAPVADRLVVSARTPEGVALFLTDPIKAHARRSLDGYAEADLVFSGAKAEALSGGLAEIEETVDFATALICAEAVGAMKFSCDTTLDYLKTRKQFGVPIGTFQALQHRVVEMYIAHEQAKSMSCLACSTIDFARDAKNRARAISAAKIKIADAARHVSQEAVQLHGGMGMSEEMKVSHAFRRLTVLARQFGDADHHLARFASL
ncbi:MAG TPA: acyl-CoA dehydrogenase [Burkholderiales bacterium]|nr:acyl-CoA dehydrogenase [Burkholderiales bacterium]